MQVSEIMTKASVSESAHDTLAAAAAEMWRQQTGSLVVLEDGRLVGIVTERDVMKAVAQGVDAAGVTVAGVMTTDVVTISSTTTLHEAARLMAARWIRHLPVVDAGTVVGVVSQRDLVGVFAALAHDPEGLSLDNDDLVRQRRLVRIEHGDLD